jgi:hypothetical protein
MIRPTDLTHARDVQWQTVASSNVHSALWSETDTVGDMYVRFLRSGPDDIYVYESRQRGEWLDFMSAISKGSWIWSYPIEDNWPYELLTMRDFADVEPTDVPKPTRRFLE